MTINYQLKLETIEQIVREDVATIKNLMAYINPAQMGTGGEQAYVDAMHAISRLERQVETDSGSHDINVPAGQMGVKGH